VPDIHAEIVQQADTLRAEVRNVVDDLHRATFNQCIAERHAQAPGPTGMPCSAGQPQ